MAEQSPQGQNKDTFSINTEPTTENSVQENKNPLNTGAGNITPATPPTNINNIDPAPTPSPTPLPVVEAPEISIESNTPNQMETSAEPDIPSLDKQLEEQLSQVTTGSTTEEPKGPNKKLVIGFLISVTLLVIVYVAFKIMRTPAAEIPPQETTTELNTPTTEETTTEAPEALIDNLEEAFSETTTIEDAPPSLDSNEPIETTTPPETTTTEDQPVKVQR